jgi:hypothetical protein
MKGNPQLSEKWVQEVLVGDPALLGFGDVVVKDVERTQAHGGRLDLLLSDPDTSTRYEVELQLGATDESHIIRTIEYWDTERRRYPQYDHVAVIVAEEITARFFNVISLFNGFIPIVAIQMSAIELTESEVTLVFTKVLDRITLGSEEEEEGEPVDRAYWEQRSSPEMLAIADRIFVHLQDFDPGVEPKYNKHYIGPSKNGVSSLYVLVRPQKRKINVEMRIPRSDEVSLAIEEAGLDTLPYDTRWNHYRVLCPPDVSDDQMSVIAELTRKAYENSNQ